MLKKTRSKATLHAWLTVAACFTVTLVIGETFHALGIFFKPLENELLLSRSLISSGYTTFMVGVAISSVIAGRLVDRFNSRPILLVCSILAGGGIVSCSQIQNIEHLRTFYFISGLGVGATWSVPGTTVQRWFHDRDRAGLALAIVISGAGAGGLIFAPLANYLVIDLGWRQAYLVLGIITFLLIVIPAFLIKSSPGKESVPINHEQKLITSPATFSWKTHNIVTTLPFISITFLVCLAELTFQAVAVHLVPHATDVGISPTSSALALGFIGGISIPGRILSGILSERIGCQKVMALSLFSTAICLLLLLFMESTLMLYCFVFLYGICTGMAMTAEVGILGEFFGMRWLGGLIGISSSIAFVAAAFSPYMMGYVFDVTGSYTIALLIILCLLLTGSITAMVIKKPGAIM